MDTISPATLENINARRKTHGLEDITITQARAALTTKTAEVARQKATEVSPFDEVSFLVTYSFITPAAGKK